MPPPQSFWYLSLLDPGKMAPLGLVPWHYVLGRDNMVAGALLKKKNTTQCPCVSPNTSVSKIHLFASEFKGQTLGVCFFFK